MVESASNGQSGSRPYTTADRRPSMTPVSGLAAIQPRHGGGTFDSGYAIGVTYSQSCSPICTTGFTSR